MGDSIFCPNCGTRQDGLPKFCFECGHDLSAIVAKRQAAAGAATPPPDQPLAPPPPPIAPPPPPGPAPVAPAPAAPVPPVVTPSAVTPPAPPAPVAPPPWSVPANQPQFQPPAAYGAQPAHQGYTPGGMVGTVGSRPTGIAILAILEVVGGVLGLWGALVLFGDVDYRNYWFGDGGTYQMLGLASLAGAIAGFVLAWGLWQLRPWAWMLGVALCVISAAVYLVIAFAVHGDTLASAAINVGVDGAVLYYLNLNSIRAIFGRPPTTMLQPAPRAPQGPQGPQWPQGPQPPQS